MRNFQRILRVKLCFLNKLSYFCECKINLIFTNQNPQRMKEKYPLYYLGTTALLSLATFGIAAAQVSSYIKLPDSYQVEKERMTPKQLQERQSEAKAKHPLLYLRKLPTQNAGKADGLTRLNRKTADQTAATSPRISNTIMRIAPEDGRKLWGNVLYDSSWAGIGSDYTAYGWYEFMSKTPVKVNSVYNFDYLRATGSGAWIGNTLYYVWYQNFWGIDMIYYYKLNTDTWEQIGEEERLPDCSLMANETALAPDGTTVYGDYLDADGMNNELCTVDYATKERTKIGNLRQAYVAMGMTSDSRLRRSFHPLATRVFRNFCKHRYKIGRERRFFLPFSNFICTTHPARQLPFLAPFAACG